MAYGAADRCGTTWKPILNREDGVLYRALAARLEADVRSGVLRPGAKLPPQRDLADFLHVNVSTVSRAFRLCELKGLLSDALYSLNVSAVPMMTELAAHFIASGQFEDIILRHRRHAAVLNGIIAK